MTPSPLRIAVLASGGGSNLQALIDHLTTLGPECGIEIALVVSDREGAGALARARSHGIPALWVPRTAVEGALANALREARVDLIVLAGYLRLIPNDVLDEWPGRVINIHPSLLPAFGGAGMYGSRVHEAVLARGARVTGATVHFVNAHFDEGPIIAQATVPVHVGDTVDTLAARVLEIEHRLYPPTIVAVARGELRLGDDGCVIGAPSRPSLD